MRPYALSEREIGILLRKLKVTRQFSIPKPSSRQPPSSGATQPVCRYDHPVQAAGGC
jgi:hypothetical protein